MSLISSRAIPNLICRSPHGNGAPRKLTIIRIHFHIVDCSRRMRAMESTLEAPVCWERTCKLLLQGLDRGPPAWTNCCKVRLELSKRRRALLVTRIFLFANRDLGLMNAKKGATSSLSPENTVLSVNKVFRDLTVGESHCNGFRSQIRAWEIRISIRLARMSNFRI